MKKSTRLLALLLGIIMILGMLPATVFADTGIDPTPVPGKIKIKLVVKDWDTGLPLPYVEMGIGAHGDAPSNGKTAFTLTSDKDGIAYKEFDYTVDGKLVKVNGIEVLQTGMSEANSVYYVWFDMGPTDLAAYSYDTSVSGKIRNYSTNSKQINKRARGAYDDFYFMQTMKDNGAYLEFEVYLKAKSVEDHTVSFDTTTIANAGDFTPITVAHGGKLDKSDIPAAVNTELSTRPLMGWTCGGLDFDFNTEIKHNVVLTPKWAEMCYVTFDTTDVSNATEFPVQPVMGMDYAVEPATDPVNKDLAAKPFLYWALNGEEYKFDETPITGNITLTPVWEEVHTVTFDTTGLSNGTDDAFKDQYVLTNKFAAEPSVTPVSANGKTFLHWSLNGEEFDFDATPVTGDITLTPVWEVEGIIHFKVYMWDHEYYVNHGTTGSPDHRADGQTMIPVDGVKMILKSYPGGASPEGTAAAPEWDDTWKGLITDERKIPVGRPGGPGTELEGVVVHYNSETGTFEGDYHISADQLQYLKPGYVIDTDPDYTVYGYYDRSVTDPNYTTGAGISYHDYVDNNKFGKESTVFDWDWYVAGEGEGAGAGNTGVRVIPEAVRRGGDIPNGTNLNDVAQISQKMIDDGFEFTFVCYVVPAVVVEFDSDGGTPDYPTQKFRPVNSIPADQQKFWATNPGSPVLGGKQFAGWYEVIGQDDAGEDILANTPWDFRRVVTHSMTLKAKYTDRLYTVLWKNEDGTQTLEEDTYSYGDVPYFDGETPSKAPEDGYVYEFIGWELVDHPEDTNVYTDLFPGPEGTTILGNQVYEARFKQIPVFYVVHHAVQGDLDDVIDTIPMSTLEDTDGYFDITVPFESDYYADAEDEFDYTESYAGVREGYLYGGMYYGEHESAEYTEDPEEELCGKELEPETGDYFYLREVSDDFLQPRILSVRRKVGDTQVERYLLTAIDKDGADAEFYREYGFNHNPQCEDDEFDSYAQSGTTQLLNDNEQAYSERYGAEYEEMTCYLYESVTTTKTNGTPVTYKTNNIFTSHPSITANDYFGCLPFDEDMAEAGVKTALGEDFSFNMHFAPYFVTADGVYVTGIIERYADFSDEANTTAPAKIDEELEGGFRTCIAPSGTLASMPGVTLASFFRAIPVEKTEEDDETDVQDIIVTVHANGETYQVAAAEAGDFTALVNEERENRESDGLRFAGWYEDEDFTAAADLSDVTESTDVYARYIDSAYFGVQNILTTSKKVVTKIKAITAVDDRDSYQEVGFDITVDGDTTRYALTKDYANVNGYAPKMLFGENVDAHSRLIYKEFSVKGLAAGTEIICTPYYVTADGTELFGDSRVMTYEESSVTIIGG